MTDIDDVQAGLDNQVKWGENAQNMIIRRLLVVARRHESELEQARTVIQNLRDRVKALEDAP